MQDAENSSQYAENIAENSSQCAENSRQYAVSVCAYVNTGLLYDIYNSIIMLLCMGNCVNSRAVTLYGYFCHLTTLDELLLCMCNVDILRAVTIRAQQKHPT